MLEGIKALIIVEKMGTVSEAALHLRLTQSAVSKRLQALENELGYKVLVKEGRRLRLTPAGQELLVKAKPLLLEIDNLKLPQAKNSLHEFSIGIADSISSSWGPALLRQVLDKMPELKLEIHVHRSSFILENIKLGRYHLGLVTGPTSTSGLVSHLIKTENMVLIGAKKRMKSETLLTIETASATWKEISPSLTNHRQLQGKQFEFVESFSAAAQMAREGFGQALIPEGIARALNFKNSEFTELSPKITRSIQLVSRKSIYEFAIIQELIQRLTKQSPSLK